jgi:hypothetical protein
MHQKCSNYALTNMLFGLCKFMWIIDLLVTLSSSHPRVPTCPSTPKMLRARERTPTPYPSIVFTFKLTIESIRELGGASTCKVYKTLSDKILASLWQPIVWCQHTHLETQNNYFTCCWWINFSPIWHLKHFMEKSLLNENVLSSTYNWIHSSWCWIHVQRNFSRSGILKLVHRTWNNPLQPTILAHWNSTSPIIIHYKIF